MGFAEEMSKQHSEQVFKERCELCDEHLKECDKHTPSDWAMAVLEINQIKIVPMTGELESEAKRISRNQIFISGQMNVLTKVGIILAKYNILK